MLQICLQQRLEVQSADICRTWINSGFLAIHDALELPSICYSGKSNNLLNFDYGASLHRQVHAVVVNVLFAGTRIKWEHDLLALVSNNMETLKNYEPNDFLLVQRLSSGASTMIGINGGRKEETFSKDYGRTFDEPFPEINSQKLNDHLLACSLMQTAIKLKFSAKLILCYTSTTTTSSITITSTYNRSFLIDYTKRVSRHMTNDLRDQVEKDISKSGFKSIEQERMLQLIVTTMLDGCWKGEESPDVQLQSHLLLLAKASFEKTEAILALFCADEPVTVGIVLVISPLNATVNQFTERANQRRKESCKLLIDFKNDFAMQAAMFNSQCVRLGLTSLRIIVATPESACQSKDLVLMLCSFGLMSIIIFDDVHCINDSTESFRPQFQNFCAMIPAF